MTPLATIRQLTTGSIAETAVKRAITQCLDDGFPPHTAALQGIVVGKSRIEEDSCFIMTNGTRDPEDPVYLKDTIRLGVNNRIIRHLDALRERIRDASATTIEQWDLQDSQK